MDNEEARKAHAASQEKIEAKIQSIKDQIDTCDSIVVKESSINELSKKIRDKKNLDSLQYQSASIRLNELKSLIKNKEMQKETLLGKLKSNTSVLAKIRTVNDNINKTLDEVKSDNEDLILDKLISSIYAPTGAQAYVLDSIIDSFNEIVTPYIDILSPNLTYSLNSYKENVKGEMVAKFSETITKNGTVVSIGSLSGGEEKGLSLCVDFALIRVLEEHFGMKLNPVVLDEPFDGLDLKGRELIIGLLEQLAENRNILIVDHMTESKTMFSKNIFVALRNDVSTIACNM
jgi:DNA repair exonuclease SbcCD ATPase subunit